MKGNLHPKECLDDYLKEIVIFHGLSDDELETVSKYFEMVEKPKGNVIYEEDESGSEMYVILTGSVEIVKKDHLGKLHRLAVLKEGDVFGEMSLIEMQKRIAMVKALEICTLGVLSKNSLYSIYKTNIALFAKIVLNIARELSRRLRKSDIEIVENIEDSNK